MPKRNFQFEKRQRELAKKEQREQKKLRQHERSPSPDDPTAEDESSPPSPEIGG